MGLCCLLSAVYCRRRRTDVGLLAVCWLSLACESKFAGQNKAFLSLSLSDTEPLELKQTRVLYLGLYLPPFPQIDIIGAMLIVWRVKGKIIRSVLCSIVFNNCAQCNTHTYEQTYSSLDWVLSHWAHFTVLRFIFVYVRIFCAVLYIACSSIVSWWGGPGGIEAWSSGHYFLQCFDTVGWVIWPIKTRPRCDL